MANTKKPTKDGSGRKSADDATKLDRLRELVSILEASDTLTSLDYEDADIVVRLARGGGGPTPMFAQVPQYAAPAQYPTPTPVGGAPGTAASPQPAAAAASDEGIETLNSPFVGTFYRSPDPKASPFTEVGAKVAKKQVLCIIEAMKLMNEIESEVSGTVVEIIPANGQAVQYGDPLFKIAVDS